MVFFVCFRLLLNLHRILSSVMFTSVEFVGKTEQSSFHTKFVFIPWRCCWYLVFILLFFFLFELSASERVPPLCTTSISCYFSTSSLKIQNPLVLHHIRFNCTPVVLFALFHFLFAICRVEKKSRNSLLNPTSGINNKPCVFVLVWKRGVVWTWWRKKQNNTINKKKSCK